MEAWPGLSGRAPLTAWDARTTWYDWPLRSRGDPVDLSKGVAEVWFYDLEGSDVEREAELAEVREFISECLRK